MNHKKTKNEGIRAKNAKKALICLGMAFLLLAAFPLQIAGQEAAIRDVLITFQGERLLVYGRLMNCFTKDMESAIMAGVPTTFTFVFNLYQERSFWYDQKVATAVLQHTVKYDSVKKTFYVASSPGKEPVVFQDLGSAKIAMAEFNGSVPLPVGGLRKDLPHYVMLKAKLDKVRLPLYMEYVFFFVSLWDFETTWYRQPIIF